MSLDRFPVGLDMDVHYPEFKVSLRLLSKTQLLLEIAEGPFARVEVVDIHVVPLGNGLFAVSWQEQDGATVAQIQDFDRQVVYCCVTLPDGRLLRMAGSMAITTPAPVAQDHRPRHNKALVLEAMTRVYQQRDASAVGQLYTQQDLRHPPGIAQGRDALQALVAQLPDAVHYEPGLVVAEGDLVAIHGRIRGWARTPPVVVDLFRIEDGRLAEHWHVLRDEMPAAAAAARIAMFEPDERARLP